MPQQFGSWALMRLSHGSCRDPSNAPVHISNGASVYLRHWGYLAKGFSLRDGNVTVQVPIIPSTLINPNETHNIILFGDSGNESPNFIIKLDPNALPDRAPEGKWD
ncbi:hypothetical protein J132_09691 [Termitomyces sp. J132]|nr:hypothetical protein J132_09691 [Termitomyces sp. J132]